MRGEKSGPFWAPVCTGAVVLSDAVLKVPGAAEAANAGAGGAGHLPRCSPVICSQEFGLSCPESQRQPLVVR